MKDLLNRLIMNIYGYFSVQVDLCTLINKNEFAILFDIGEYIRTDLFSIFIVKSISIRVTSNKIGRNVA